ncbi:MAG: FAD-dependent monooxygenase, partial [SAR324 cluster bacterium]|nr:FAD-dependent monooxygenase [SAR324 cluster bacterium]
MKIAIVGGGPAGLYLGYLLKRDHSGHSIDIFEQNPQGNTWGFGVVFSDRALDFLNLDDPETYQRLIPKMEHWVDLKLDLLGEQIILDGISFASIGRLQLLEILSERLKSVGIFPKFSTPLKDLSCCHDYDLVVGADGLNSVVRQQPGFHSETRLLSNFFAWYGTKKPFDTLTQSFRNSPWGPFNAHHYRYSKEMSTFIIETDRETWERSRFSKMSDHERIKACETIFADVLEGEPLVQNRSTWRQFPVIQCENWFHENMVLIGDALHTAHFSIGSGTRLALEDSLALSKAIRLHETDLQSALKTFEKKRKPVLSKLVDASLQSAKWYENFGEHMNLPPWEFAESYLARAGRIDE